MAHPLRFPALFSVLMAVLVLLSGSTPLRAASDQDEVKQALEKLRSCSARPGLADSLEINLPATGLDHDQWAEATRLYREVSAHDPGASRHFLDGYAQTLSNLLLTCRKDAGLIDLVEDTPWRIFSPEQRGGMDEAFKKALWSYPGNGILLFERARFYGQRKPEDIARFDSYSKSNLKKVLELKDRTDQGVIIPDTRRARNLAMTMLKQYDLQQASYDQDPKPAERAAEQLRDYIWRSATLNVAPPFTLGEPGVKFDKQFDREKWSLDTFISQGDESAGEVVKAFAQALYLSYHLPSGAEADVKRLRAQVALECAQRLRKTGRSDPWVSLLAGLFGVDNQVNADDVAAAFKEGIKALPPDSPERSVFTDPDRYFQESGSVPGLGPATVDKILETPGVPEGPAVSYWTGLMRVELLYGDPFTGERGWNNALGKTLVRNPNKVVVPDLGSFADSTLVSGGTPGDPRRQRILQSQGGNPSQLPGEPAHVLSYTPNQVSVYDRDDPNKAPEVFVDVTQGKNRWGSTVPGGVIRGQWDQALVHGDAMKQIQKGATAYQDEAGAMAQNPYLLFVYPTCSRGSRQPNPRTELVLAVFRPKRGDEDPHSADWWKGKNIDVRAIRLAQDGSRLEEKLLRSAVLQQKDVHALGDAGDLLIMDETTESLRPGTWEVRTALVDPSSDRTMRPGGQKIVVRGIGGQGPQLSDARLFFPEKISPEQGGEASARELDFPNFLQRITTEDRLDLAYDAYALAGEPDSTDFRITYAVERAWPFFAVLDPLVVHNMTRGQEDVYSMVDSTLFVRYRQGEPLRLDTLIRWLDAFVSHHIQVEYRGRTRALTPEDGLTLLRSPEHYDEIQILPPRFFASAESTSFSMAEKKGYLPRPYRTVRASFHISSIDLGEWQEGRPHGLLPGDYVLLAQVMDRRAGRSVIQATSFTVAPAGELFPKPAEAVTLEGP
jgi:hypothetical protein